MITQESFIAYLYSSSIFQFFYSIYDYFLQPQQKFYCFTLGKQNDNNTNTGFKEMAKLLYSSNALTEKPNENDPMQYLYKLEYKNFYFEDRSVSDYTSLIYFYPCYVKGSSGMVIFINGIEEEEDIEFVMKRKYKFSLLDIVKFAKCDDKAYVSMGHIVPERISDFRPILFVVQLLKKDELFEKVKKTIENTIEEAGYEKENTMVVVHSEEEESNIYHGLEWIFMKKSD